MKRCAIVSMLFLSGCLSTDPLDGVFACNVGSDCPDGWFCHSDDRCYQTAQGSDAGRDDAGAGDAGPGDASVDCNGAVNGTPCETAMICVDGTCGVSRCGDGYTDAAALEECDDGNGTAFDGCEPGKCTFTCNDPAQCEDANVCTVELCGATTHVCEVGTPPTGTACPIGTCDGAGMCRPTCDSLYGSVSGYTLCDTRATECEFSAATNPESCADICAAGGGTCIDGIDNLTADCLRETSVGCGDTTHANNICICSRGP